MNLKNAGDLSHECRLRRFQFGWYDKVTKRGASFRRLVSLKNNE